MRISDWSSDVCSSDLLVITGGVESMSRAPFVMAKAEAAFSRTAEIYDTTIGWRFVNRLMKQKYGVDSMPETAENVAEQYQISRADQDAFALRSQQRALNAIKLGLRSEEHTSELQSLMRSSYAVFCLKKTNTTKDELRSPRRKKLSILAH